MERLSMSQTITFDKAVERLQASALILVTDKSGKQYIPSFIGWQEEGDFILGFDQATDNMSDVHFVRGQVQVDSSGNMLPSSFEVKISSYNLA